MPYATDTPTTQLAAELAGMPIAAPELPEQRMPERLPAWDHTWCCHPRIGHYEILQGFTAAMVRTKPSPNGRYLWQFRGVASYADTVREAKDYVEAGAEHFAALRRNPYLP